MVSLPLYRRVRRELLDLGYGSEIDWSENVKTPATADRFASQAIYCQQRLGTAFAHNGYHEVERFFVLFLTAERGAGAAFGRHRLMSEVASVI